MKEKIKWFSWIGVTRFVGLFFPRPENVSAYDLGIEQNIENNWNKILKNKEKKIYKILKIKFFYKQKNKF